MAPSISCADCQTVILSRIQDDEKCPNCGSRSRWINLPASATLATTSTVTATAQAIHPVSAASSEAFGTPTITQSAPEPTTLTGEVSTHSVSIVFSPCSDGKSFLVEVKNTDGGTVAVGMGDDHVAALLDLIPALLPPDHPERETLQEQPDDLL